MESIGERLSAAREAKKISIKDVSKETNIAVPYIEALEEENFDKFPGETYLIGFLRAYAEYLKLDSEEIIRAYRGYKIGESATPLEELTKPTKQPLGSALSGFFEKYRNILIIVIIAAAVFLILWGVKTMYSGGVDVSGGNSIENIKNEFNANNPGAEIQNIRPLQLHDDRGFVLVYVNEAVQFLVDKKEVVLLVKSIEGDKVTLEVFPGKMSETLEMDKTVMLSIPESPREIKVTLKGLTEKRAKLLVELGANIGAQTNETADAQGAEGPAAVAPAGAADNDNTSVIALNKKNLKIVFQAAFTEKSFLEIYIDGSRKYRGFVEPGATQRFEANEFIQIKAGNAGGMNAKINGKKFVFGKSGQVVNKMVTWKKDVANPNLYHIVVKDQ